MAFTEIPLLCCVERVFCCSAALFDIDCGTSHRGWSFLLSSILTPMLLALIIGSVTFVKWLQKKLWRRKRYFLARFRGESYPDSDEISWATILQQKCAHFISAQLPPGKTLVNILSNNILVFSSYLTLWLSSRLSQNFVQESHAFWFICTALPGKCWSIPFCCWFFMQPHLREPLTFPSTHSSCNNKHHQQWRIWRGASDRELSIIPKHCTRMSFLRD